MPRLGLCCIFRDEPIRFRTTTAAQLLKLPREAQLAKLSEIVLHNTDSLNAAITFCAANGIGAFRIISHFLPRTTHEAVAYTIESLPEGNAILQGLRHARNLARRHNIRLSFHPDQFIVLNSPRPEVVDKALPELEYHAMLAELVGADVINLHAGGVHGDKCASLGLFAENFKRLSSRARKRLTLENDDVCYSVADLLPLCERLKIPLVYDVHHHRCNPDDLNVEDATRLCAATWRGREQYLHLSSPRNPWGTGDPKPHADFIDFADFPECWRGIEATIDVEAKAKELAVIKLQRELAGATRRPRRQGSK